MVTRAVSRKSTFVTLCSLLVVVSMLMGACATPAPAAPTAAPAPKATEAPKAAPVATAAPAAPAGKALPADAAKEQVLRIAAGSAGATSFDFFPMRGGSDSETFMPLLYIPPMYFDEAFQALKPGVFNKWESNADFTVWTFKLDPRAKWSDNSPITAADFKGTWEIMTDPLTQQGRITSYLGNVQGFQALRDGKATEMTGLKVVDDKTLQVTLVKADPVFNFRIATTHMNAIKPEQAKKDPVKGFGGNWWKPEGKPLVSGPYMLATFNADTKEATMVKNPNFWMDEGPYLDKIQFQFVPDQNTIATMFQNNQIDVSLAPVDLAVKKQFPDLFRTFKSVGFNLFWFRPANPPTDDINVRKALIESVNFEEMAKVAFPLGDFQPTIEFIDPDLPCKAGTTFFKFDVEQAKKDLAASKYGSADKLPKLRITPRGNWPPMVLALQYMMESWRKNLGITNIEYKETPAEFGQDARSLNLTRDDVVIRFPDSATYMRIGAHSQGEFVLDNSTKKPDDPGPVMLGYSNAKLDQLVDQAMALGTTDPKRCELAKQAQQTFMADAMVAPFGKALNYIMARDYVKGYAKGPDRGLIEPWKIYMAKH